jgi:hypothetical protein
VVGLSYLCGIRDQFFCVNTDTTFHAVLELNMTDTISDAIEKLYCHKVLGAPVRDAHQMNHVSLADQYVGLLDFASLVLWALEVLCLNLESPELLFLARSSSAFCIDLFIDLSSEL